MIYIAFFRIFWLLNNLGIKVLFWSLLFSLSAEMTSLGQSITRTLDAVQVQVLWENDLQIPQMEQGQISEPHGYTSNTENLLKPFIQLITSVKALDGLADAVGLKVLEGKVQRDMDWLRALGRDTEVEIPAYILQYRLTCLKQDYFRLKLAAEQRDSSLPGGNKTIELVELISKYLKDLYSSGIINGRRKNHLTEEYQLIEKSMVLLYEQNASGSLDDLIVKLLRVSKLGEFELNKAVIREKDTYSELIRNLLLETEPLEAEMSVMAYNNDRYPAIFQKRNLLRDKYLKLIRARSVAPSEKPKTINEDVTRIDFFEGKKHLFQFVVRGERSQLLVHKREGYYGKLASLINNFHCAPDYLTGKADLLYELREELNQLYRLFFGKLNFPLSHKLIVETDGSLNALPFESLVDDYQNFLVSSHSFRYGASGSNKEDVLNPGSALIWLSGTFESEILQLPNAKIESDLISERYRGYDQAYRLADLEMKEGLAIISTHGVYDSRGLPALLLTDSDTVSMAEFYQLHGLPAAMVINACASLAGLNVSGEGTLSIGRRAMELGADQLLANLWVVEDRTAAVINAGYLKSLRGGELSSVSLSQSKKEFLSEADEFYAHPFFWSPLVHYGNDIRLTRTKSSWRYMFFLLPCLLLFKFRFRLTFV